MKDRRPVGDLSIEELEEVLRLRRQEERLKQLALNGGGGRYGALIAARPRHAVVRAGIQWRWIGDKVLLLIEMLALLGFLLIAARLFLTVDDLNRESRIEQAAPTPSPTPMISAEVLPGGHTPPDAQGYSEPAIPAHLRGLITEMTPLPAPTPGPEQAQRILIPAIQVDAPVVEGDDWESLKKGAGHHIGSANPGARGNAIISAHNDIYGEIFRDLPLVQVGQEILVQTETQVYRYQVQQTRIIAPNDVSVMQPTTAPVLTLISCYPYRVDTHRIVVIAALQP